MKKTVLSAAIAVALGLSSGVALAAVNLDATGGAASPAKYASEINRETVSSVTGTALDGIIVKLGFGIVANNTDYFARYDLGGGSFATALTAGVLTMPVAGSVVQSAGGAANGSHVIFNLQPTADFPDTGILTLALGTAGLKLAAGSGDVTLRYRLYSNPADASNGTDANKLKDVTATLVQFSPGIKFSTTPNTTTASVTSEFKKFLADAESGIGADAVVAQLAKITYAVDTTVADHTGTALAATSTILNGAAATGTKLSVTGNFGAAVTANNTSLWLDSVANCTGGVQGAAGATTVTAIAADKASATIDIGAPAAATTDFFLCYKGDGTLAFSESDYKVTLAGVAASTNYDSTKLTGTSDVAAGAIDRDGTELQATFATTNAADANRFIFINTGTTAAPITGCKIYTNTGAAANCAITLPIDIPAGGRKAVQMLTDVSSALGTGNGTAAAVVFSIGAVTSSIQGTYQLKLPGSDVQTVVQMVRPGTN